MYYHLPINIRSIGDCQAAECALCARCSDVAGAAWVEKPLYFDPFGQTGLLTLAIK